MGMGHLARHPAALRTDRHSRAQERSGGRGGANGGAADAGVSGLGAAGDVGPQHYPHPALQGCGACVLVLVLVLALVFMFCFGVDLLFFLH